jgi:tetratricopeptide (TPR) repeat protein
MLWTITPYDFLLLGSASRITIDPELLQSNFERGKKDLEEVKVQDLYSIVSMISLRDAELDRFAANAAMNTDAQPILEFRAPLYIYANTADENFRAIADAAGDTGLLDSPSAENRRHRGEMLVAGEAFTEAQKEFQAAGILNPDDEQTRDDLIDLYSRQNDYTKAIELLDAELKTNPKKINALEKLADALADKGSGRLAEVVDHLLSVAPNDPAGLYHLATIRLYQGRADEAIRAVKRALEVDPKSTRARNLLAIAYAQTYQPQLAETEFQHVIKDAPEDSLSFNNYGLFLLEHNRPAEAREQFQRAIRLNPDNVQGFVGVGETFRQAGNMRTAQTWYRKALRMDPNQPVARQYSR